MTMRRLLLIIIGAFLALAACESEKVNPLLSDEEAVIFLMNTSDLGQHYFDRDIFYRGPQTSNIGVDDDDYVLEIDSVRRDINVVDIDDSVFEQGFDSTRGALCDIMDEFFGKLNVTTSSGTYTKLFRSVLQRRGYAIKPLPDGALFQGWIVRGSTPLKTSTYSPARVTIESYTVSTKTTSFTPPSDPPIYRSADLLSVGRGDSLEISVTAADTLTCYVSFKDSGGLRRFRMENSAPNTHTVSLFASDSPIVNRTVYWVLIEAYGPSLYGSSSRIDLSGAVAGIPYKLTD
jgi:hypothetical protein